ncbi:hypothetical protein LNKW23_19360 [Paralimibaculum aggregatum]|uniref:M15 family peptidase n=1 Tax=Paralimibaculum aggregatum TaxID=3036245 RepID=A0ABQ6LNE0_9RHOB|nr:hypothetical protein [Limibaculum sp. NKW23]GMG82723.1 hypothetical protein LNKW23_19360 [Limibaculum sp. NKW23]
MADDLNSAATDIESKVKKFIKVLTGLCEELHIQSLQYKRAVEAKGGRLPKKWAPFPERVSFSISRNKRSLVRTPAEQAAAVSRGGSWVCWGGHMSDKARHVILRVDGTSYYGARKAFGYRENLEDFKRAWVAAMKAAGLVNHRGKLGWGDGDEFHLELPNSKISRRSAKARACMDEYVRLTREKAKPKNDRFETKYKKLIEAAAKRVGVTL